MKIRTGNLAVGQSEKLALIAGPCVVESEALTLRIADRLKQLSHQHDFPLIFKASYKKANRTSLGSFATLGADEALRILEKVKRELGLPILTDVHSEQEVGPAAEMADILQIPAFLCRQTDLLLAAARSGRAVNIKKGQFMAPEDMRGAVEKVTSTGNDQVLLTERGTTFGYHNLVVDFRALVIMRSWGVPVVFDCTHSVQLPGAENGVSGGRPEFILPLARAAVAVGCDALFVETHPDPSQALSDAASQLPLDRMEQLIESIREIRPE